MPPPQRSGSANQRPSRGGGAGRGASGRGAAGRGSFGRGGASRGGSFGRGGAGRGSSFGRGGEGRGGRGAGRGSFGRGEGRGASGRGGADRGSAKRSTSALQLKKGKTSYHKEKFKRDRMEGREYRRPTEGGKPSYTKRSHSSEGDAQTHGVPHGHGTPKSSAPIDLHLASKISSELRADIATFKSRKGSNDNFGKELNRFFDLIPPMLVTQHLPAEVANFRSYLSRFQKGSANAVDAFMNWHEWASYEVNKGKTFHGASTNTKTKAEKEEEEAETEGKADSAPAEKEKKTSATQQSLAKTVREREHMKALLQMCVRHNSAKRKEGQHAFINHINHKLSSDEVDCRSLDRLRATGHHSVAYALSRLLLGMATDDMAQLVLHCHALYLVLTQTRITASVILALLDEEMALGTRMKAVQARLTKKDRKPASGEEDGEDDGDEDEDEIDPDDISDPTKGERNQRLTAAVFALGALVMSHASMSTEEARRVFIFLCFCYVEQKATRVASANLLFSHLQGMHESLLHDEVAMQWSTYAFFFYPKMEYFRPEALQLLLRLMERDQDKDLLRCLPPTVSKYLPLDPLEPTTLEQIANALFRKEQVTAVHPMVHPVWGDLLDLIQRRCAMGESLKEHVSSFVHNAIAPYRRGNADLPRRVLFQSLAGRLGQLIVQSEDADQRAEALHLASKNIGYGKRTAAKPTPLAELRNLSVESIGAKVTDLLRQYRITKDTDPAATVNRTWILRELRNCLSVPMPSGVVCSYVNEAAKALMDFGFLGANTRDTLSANRCIYMLADILSFTFSASVARPQCSWKALDIIHHYLSCEEKGRCRFDTAVNKSEFRKARNRIVEALEETSKRSVLFYESRDMEILFTLLFFVLSVDDGTNAEAVELAKHVIPDLCQFYVSGTLETLDLLLDVLMALIMRTASPMQVMPLMTFIRRNATGAILKFSKFIRSTASLNLLLAPLRDAYHTDSRELARQKKAKQVAGEQSEEDEEEEDSDDENGAAHAATAEDASGSEEDSADEEDDEESDGDDGDDDASSITEKDEDGDESTDAESDSGDDNEDDDDSSTEGDNDEDKEDAADAPEEEDDDALEDDEADEAPTQQYLDALKGMVTNVDLDHHYASDTASKEKSDVVRAIQMVSRIGASMQSPLVVHLFQVLLAVCRENVKSSDEVVFASAMSAIEMLLLAKNRYFGTFVGATELFQLLGDIQSYCRKLERTLLTDRRVSAKAAAMIRGRMHKLKRTALRVFHYTAMLAYKNHAGEEVRVTFSEYYKSIFCDRGWDMKRILPNLKKDMYYYRQGFAWVLLPAALEKYDEVAVVEGPQRVRVFSCCCTLIEAMLPRFSGLPKGLKESCGAAVGQFLQSIALEDVYAFKHTAPYTFLHTIKMVIQYNNRVHLDTKWVETNIVNKAVDDDNIQLSGASIRTLASLERMLGMTPRAKETKAPVPVKVLYQQFEKLGEKEKTDFHRKAKKVRAKILKALLSHRNSDPTDAERATKRRRKEELRVEDRLQRQVLRQSTKTVLSKEERAEKRKRIMMAKQDRIAKNKLRKRQLHENRVRSFDRWREQKLAQAAANEE